ncbi:hypoxanthine-guanine phosphoribosyltransferase [Methylomagnum ishizawai]|uniref:hypoxanthine-guanine phosphoribosyltransferase n=1 Tax=Methylomagnum ishizawai TaxID=1760988 RepID=UPI001C3439AC|nr:hypoxanthine-guanine phosphoribosyltransferase [Methylomagnum ishizawai]BBL75957.1 hypoxanthine-guanine phosphoribosyltransferase [Methylomagnum ishizawai]
MTTSEEIARVAAEADCLYTEAQIDAAIDRMAADIATRLQDQNPLVLSVLNGGILPTARLLLRLRFPLEIDSIKAGRYQGATRGGAVLRWQHQPDTPLQGRVVLLVDDVLDEGITLAELRRWCLEQGAAAVHIAVLVDKDLGRDKPCRADFTGLVAENRYLFGYGMDYKGYLRNWPGIYACTTVY